ncbi:replication protein [Arsenophonus sp. PmNCSU2021_1]|uniref:replication protein n=1 Tax=Arsenophonus sp. PmNCSU2021_1 TaxID=3118989 RepID=UPI002FEFFA2A
MTNVTYADFEAQKEENKINVFELEEGYTRISNNILEAILTAGLTQHQLLIVMAVLRKTYGYNKKIDWVSNWQLSELTGLLPHKCSAAKSALLKRKILISSGRFVGINQCIQEWQGKTNADNEVSPEFDNKKDDNTRQMKSSQFGDSHLPESGNNIEPYPNEVNLPQSGKKSLPELGKKNTYPNPVIYPNQVRKSLPESGKHKRQTTKENKIINNYISPIVPLTKKSELDLSSFEQLPSESVWGDYLQHRKNKKAPLTQTALNRLATAVNEANALGYSTDNVLAECMLRNWQGFNAAWLENKRSSNSRRDELEAAWNDTSWANGLEGVLCNAFQH